MNDFEKPVATAAVACESCRRELPPSAARIEAANDYVMYFCGQLRAAGANGQ